MGENNIYIAACTPDGGIFHYHMDKEGYLSFSDMIQVDRPMYIVHNNGILYASLRCPFAESAYSGVISIPLCKNGIMKSPSDAVSTLGEVSAHLCVHNGVVYTANYISGSVSKLPNRTVRHFGQSVNAIRQKSPHPHFITFDPPQKYILTADLGLDTIFTYTTDLDLVDKATVPAGSGCRHLAFSELGDTVWCVNELSSDISVFKYMDGHLEYLETVPAMPDTYSDSSIAAAIRTDYNNVYISHRGYDAISVFSCLGAHLSKQKDIPCGGRGPRDFIVENDCIICTNEKSDSVTVIRNDTVIQEIELPSPISVIAV